MTLENSAVVPRAPRPTMFSTVASHCARVRRIATTFSNGWHWMQSRRAVASRGSAPAVVPVGAGVVAGCGGRAGPRRAPAEATSAATKMPAQTGVSRREE